MSTVAEIEVAIAKLAPTELGELERWIVRHAGRVRAKREAKKHVITTTSGCMPGRGGEEFERHAIPNAARYRR
jgi:hypothetical protein